MVKRLKVMEKKLTNSGPFRKSVDKHSIYAIKKKQMIVEAGDEDRTATEQFYSLAASYPHRRGQLSFDDLLTQNLRRNPRTQGLGRGILDHKIL